MLSVPREGLSFVTGLIIGLGFSSVRIVAENALQCENVNDESQNICYFKVSEGNRTWRDAKELCKTRNATLPMIRNEQEQLGFTNYLKTTQVISEVWTSGKNFSYSTFTWLNGQPLSETGSVSAAHNTYTHVKLDRDLSFKALDPRTYIYPLCQFKGNKCKSSGLFQWVDGSCLNQSSEDVTWYYARNKCLAAGGDLAILNQGNVTSLEQWLDRSRTYWIGLRSSSFRWSANETDTLQDEIFYTNFTNGTALFHTADSCISINPSDGEWKVGVCNAKKTTVCQRRNGSNPLQSGTPSVSHASSPTTPTSASNAVTVSVVIGVIVIVVCIVVIVIVLVKSRKHSKPESESGNRSRQKGQDATAAVNYRAVTQPHVADDGQYAEIALQNPEVISNPQTGTTYVSLDFQKELQQKEPTTGANPAALYAVPFGRKSGKTNTNGKASHPIKIGPKGDVYALPSTQQRASSAAGPEVGRIYANIQTPTA